MGIDLAVELPKKKFAFLDSLEALSTLDPKASRVVALFDGEFDLAAAVDHAIRILSRNPKGFFLMVESNNHSKDVKQTLDRTVTFDRIIRKVAGQFKQNSLILFTADHSYDLRLPRGPKGSEIVPLVKVDGSHSAEEVLVAAEGPGSTAVRGIFPNTRIFRIMMDAYGWPPEPLTAPKGSGKGK